MKIFVAFGLNAPNTEDESLRSTIQDATKLICQLIIPADQLARAKGVQSTRSTGVAG